MLAANPVCWVQQDIEAPDIPRLLGIVVQVVVWNTNGLRSVIRKGAFGKMVMSMAPDIICLTEIRTSRAKADKLIEPTTRTLFGNYLINHGYVFNIWNPCRDGKLTEGYSGTAILSKKEFRTKMTVMGDAVIDREGRFIAADFEDFYIILNYYPCAGNDELAEATGLPGVD